MVFDFDEFRNLNDRCPMILHPAFRMQDKLQKYTLGEEEWVKVMENINYWQKIKEYTDKEGEAPPLITVGASWEASAEVLRPPARGPRVHRLPIEDGAG